MGERGVRNAEVDGSIPFTSTIKYFATTHLQQQFRALFLYVTSATQALVRRCFHCSNRQSTGRSYPGHNLDHAPEFGVMNGM